MVVKIQPPASNISGVLSYNMQKVNAGHAEIIMVRSLTGEGISGLKESFSCLEKANIRTELPVFHASINPSESDGMDDTKTAEFAQELMEKLGYGAQPFILLRHDDIARTHYHIVSYRTGTDGKKIKDSNERYRCNRIIRELAGKYGYSVTEEKTQKEVHNNRFNPKDGNVMEQFKTLLSQAKRFNFTDMAQFEALMKSMGLDIDISGKDAIPTLTFYGLDRKNRRCTVGIKDSAIGVLKYQDIQKHIRRSSFRENTRAVSRISNIVSGGISRSTSERHLSNILLKCGISLHTQKNRKGQITGVLFVDSRTRFCIDGNDTAEKASAKLLEHYRTSVWGKDNIRTGRKTRTVTNTGRIIGLAGSMLGRGAATGDDSEYMLRFRQMLEEEEHGTSQKI